MLDSERKKKARRSISMFCGSILISGIEVVEKVVKLGKCERAELLKFLTHFRGTRIVFLIS